MAEQDVKIQDFPSIFSLKGKVAVVTGGSRGLGLHAASGLLQAGCARIYITSRKADACKAACDALNALPNPHGFESPRAISVPADVSKLAGIEELVNMVTKSEKSRGGGKTGVDILVANAGATWGAPFEEHTDKSWDRVMDLNVKSIFFCVQKFLPLLTARATPTDPARVITTASVAGVGVGTTGQSSTPSYSASKAAVIHLTKNLAVELGPRNIRCNSFAPGFFPSKMASGLIDTLGGVEEMGKSTPTQRLGEPEDIAGVVVFLASRASSHVNGANILLDGGKVWAAARL